jgi:hypothetical protein
MNVLPSASLTRDQTMIPDPYKALALGTALSKQTEALMPFHDTARGGVRQP